MSTASEKPGKPDGKSGSGGSTTPSGRSDASRTEPAARGKAAGSGARAAPAGKGAKAKAVGGTGKPAPGDAPAATPEGASPAAGAPRSGSAKSGGGNGAPGGGGAPPRDDKAVDGSASGGGTVWGRVALYGGSAVIGGLIVAAVLLLTDVTGKLGGAPALTDGESGQIAALRREVDALDSRVDALANLSGSEPLTRQVAEIRNTLASLQGRAGADAEVGAPSTARRDEMRARLEQTGEELIRLDTKLAQLTGEVTRTETRLSGRVASLEALTPDDLPRLLDQAADKKTVGALLARVDRLEQDELTRDVRSAARALALANLARAVETSRPFSNELKALAVLEPDKESVAALAAYAETGLPSVSTLTARFDTVADDVVKAWRKAHGKGFLGNLWDNIIGLFRVRPVGEVAGMAAPALVARAEHRLAGGDLYAAVQELSKLGEPEKAAAGEWLAAARSRLHLESLMAEVNSEVLQEIAAAEAARRALRESFKPPASQAPAAPDGAAPDSAAPKTGGPERAPSGSTGPGTQRPEPAGNSAPPTEDEADANASER